MLLKEGPGKFWVSIGGCLFELKEFYAVDRRYEEYLCTINLRNGTTLICKASPEEVIKEIQEAWEESFKWPVSIPKYLEEKS